MSFLNFLSDVKLEEVKVDQKRTAVAAKDRNPEDAFMGIRIWKGGEVYPSKLLVNTLNLEYVNVSISMVPVTKEGQPVMEDKDGQQVAKMKREYTYPEVVGNALDVIDTSTWLQYPKDQKRLILVAAVPKNLPKVDLFGSTKYNEDGTPIATVLTQGASTFGKELLNTIKEVYGSEVNETGFIDLEICIDSDLSTLSSTGIFLLPKKVSRGAEAGKLDYERRENISIFPLVPSSLLNSTEPSIKEETIEEVTA